MQTIDNYLKDVTPSQRQELERIRKIVKETVPEVEETISWEMPTFKYKHRNVIHFAAFKNHMSLFPGPDAVESVKEDLEKFTISKGTIQFTEDNPLPESVIKKILKYQVAHLSRGRKY
jgi:uncharacterized protein YdhG (YjbR/CyaY superfamily)